MRYTRMRFDIWLTLLIAFGISLGTVKIAELVLPGMYEAYVEENIVGENEVGGPAGEDVFRVQNIDDILSHDTFTIVSRGIEYRNRGAGYYNGVYTYAVTLPSGEVVAAQINMENVQMEGDYYSSDHTLPLGRVVWEDLTESEIFMNQISYGVPLSRTDFYVDMRGSGGGGYRRPQPVGQTDEYACDLAALLHLQLPYAVVGLHHLGRLYEHRLSRGTLIVDNA